MAELASIPARMFIPYFRFHIAREQNLLSVYVHINYRKFNDIQFVLQDNELSIISDVYMTTKCMAKIRLPLEVVHPEELKPVHLDERFIQLFFEIMSPQPKPIRALDLDLITHHLSWHDNAVYEAPDILVKCTSPTSQVAKDIVECLTSQVAKDIVECLRALELNGTAENPHYASYGFARRYHGRMADYEGNYENVLELREPENIDAMDRRLLRMDAERKAFSVEHYLADFFLEQNPDDDESISIFHLVRFKPYWHSMVDATERVLKTHDMALLAGLPSKKFGLSGDERLEVLHSLFDIILAYAYDYRLTRGKPNSESAWNISKLSATFSWFQVHRHIGDAFDSFMRRSFAYPICRNWVLSWLIYKDALEIFNLGRRQILNCLLHIHEIFDDDGDRKFLNELYIEDYLIWIQQVHPETIKNYVKLIKTCTKLQKENVFLELPILEYQAVQLVGGVEVEKFNKWRKMSDKLWTEVKDRPINRGLLTHNSDDSETSSSDQESGSEEESDTSSEEESETASEEESDNASEEDSDTLSGEESETASEEESDIASDEESNVTFTKEEEEESEYIC